MEIRDYPDKEAFYTFYDSLQNWAKLEIERRGAQDLASAIAITESLTEFEKTENVKSKGNKGNGGGGNKPNKEEISKPAKKEWSSKGKKDDKGGNRPLKCFLCEGPHMA